MRENFKLADRLMNDGISKTNGIVKLDENLEQNNA